LSAVVSSDPNPAARIAGRAVGNSGTVLHTCRRLPAASLISLPGPIVGFALALGAFAWLYSGVFAGLLRHWRSDDNYSHGFLVPLLAAYFVWERRGALCSTPARQSTMGAVVIIVSLLVFLAGTFAAELFLTRISLIGVLAGCILFLLGRRHLTMLYFPLGFLLLMVPLPAILFNQIAFPLQLIASRAGELVIATAGVPVLREGNVLQLPTRTLEVAEACSGIRSLVSLLMLSILLGYFTERAISRRVLIALAAVPLAIIANGLRVAGTGLAAEWISPAAADGFFHSFSGWVVFLVACGGLLVLQRLLPRRCS
jgi:exosortase